MRSKLLILVATVVSVGLCAAQAFGGEGPGQSTSGASSVVISVGQSAVVHAPWPVKRVSITEPKFADVKVLTSDQVLVIARSAGSTDLLLWNEKENLWQTRIEVLPDVGYIRAELEQLFPRATLKVSQSGDIILLTGSVPQAENAVAIHKFLMPPRSSTWT